MKHARKDYDRFQDPLGKIGEDEPVFIVRAQDKCAPGTVLAWANLARMAGANESMVDIVEEHALRMIAWQQKNGCKVPDLAAGS